jgi:hypothetical protein
MKCATLYYEVHVTLDPISEQRVKVLRSVADAFGYRIAKLIMRKEGGRDVPHTDDMFLTTRGVEYGEVVDNMVSFIRALGASNFKVRRYKIEDTLIDSAQQDILNLIGG